mmetsp:Transcript_42638/g.49882  ORF Transcript_42638/g.49882 Transcript_42638/m.49882 type:complete len:110 (+) Transcript_42638:790-1119(+)
MKKKQDEESKLRSEEIKINNENEEMPSSEVKEDKPLIDSKDSKQKVNLCNGYMRRLISKDYLSNHFKNIIKTVDEYFMYRKQFSNYYASNCFLTYAFSLTDNTHQNIKI